MDDKECEWLSNHLGHTVKTHKEFYRQHEGVVEITKIGKLLLATEQGIQQYAGQGLTNIDAEGSFSFSLACIHQYTVCHG